MHWHLSDRCDPRARDLADRHYNRQSIGADNFVPPGRCLVLWVRGAFWVTSWPFAEYVRHAWGGAWVCSAFRREYGDFIASDMVESALAATRWRWPDVPDIRCAPCAWKWGESYPSAHVAMVTFVDEAKTKRKRDPGRCFRRAGFVECAARTQGGLVALHIAPKALPPAQAPIGASLDLFPEG